MKDVRFKFLQQYVAQILNAYQIVQHKKTTPYGCKIAGKEICPRTHEELLVIQSAGKNFFLKLSPEKLATDDSMLEQFSPSDIRMITYLACKKKFEQKSKPGILYRLVDMLFSRDKENQQQIITLEKINTEELISTSAETLSNSPDILSELSSHDAHKIGFAAGMESVLKERGK